MGPPYWPRFCPMGFSNSPHSPKGGSEKKYRARPNRLWGHPKGPLGGHEPHLSSPILPRFRPERRKSLFWPLGAGTPQRAKKKWRNGAKLEPATGMAGEDARGALGTAGAMGPAESMTGFVAPHSTSALGQLASCVRPTSADSNTQ